MLSLNNSNCWKLLRANTATTWDANPSVNAKNVMDWTISSQVTSGEVKGSTTRKNNLEQVKFPRTGCACQMLQMGDMLNPMVAKKLFVKKEELEKKYRELKSAAKTGAFYGVSKKLIFTYLKKYGITVRTNIEKKPKQSVLRKMTDNGFTAQQIAKKYSVNVTSAYNWLHAYGLPIYDYYHKGFIINHSGYKLVKATGENSSNNNGYIREHRKIMENFLGRKLSKKEIVHHKDGDKTNNAFENLQILNKSEHCKLHLPRLGTGKDIVSS